MAEKSTTMVSLRMEDELRAKVQEIAEAEDRSFSQQLHRIIREWLEQREAKPRRTAASYDAFSGKPHRRK